MTLYYETRKRQYDGKIAVWTQLPIYHDTTNELEYHYPYRNSPNVKTPYLRWVCVFVGYDMEDVETYLADCRKNKSRH